MVDELSPARIFSLEGRVALITGGAGGIAATSLRPTPKPRPDHLPVGVRPSMPAYVINDMEVTDPDTFSEYAKLSPPTIARYGGRFLARGGAVDLLEGDRAPKRLVVIEFPSVERAKERLDSPEYAPARRIRRRASKSNMVVVEGYAPA